MTDFENMMKENLPAYMVRFLLVAGFDTLDAISKLSFDPNDSSNPYNIFYMENFLKETLVNLSTAEKAKFVHRTGWPASLTAISFSPGHLVLLEKFQKRLISASKSSLTLASLSSGSDSNSEVKVKPVGKISVPCKKVIHQSLSSSSVESTSSDSSAKPVSTKIVQESRKENQVTKAAVTSNGLADTSLKKPGGKRRRNRKRKQSLEKKQSLSVSTKVSNGETLETSTPLVQPQVKRPCFGDSRTQRKIVYGEDGEVETVEYMESTELAQFNKAVNRKNMKKAGNFCLQRIPNSRWDQTKTDELSEDSLAAETNSQTPQLRTRSRIFENTPETAAALKNGVTVIDLNKKEESLQSGRIMRMKKMNVDLDAEEEEEEEEKEEPSEMKDDLNHEEEDLTESKEDVKQEKELRDYTVLPAVSGPPSVGDSIAFKMLEINPDTYCPELSSFKEGVVIDYDTKSQRCLVDLTTSNAIKRRADGKFEVHMEDEECVISTLDTEQKRILSHWSAFADVRLVQKKAVDE